MTSTDIETSRILRFEVPVDDQWHLVRVPKNGVLSVASRHARSVDFWMRETKRGSEIRAYRVFGTGQPIPEVTAYEGTTVAPGGALVWHLLSATAGVAESP